MLLWLRVRYRSRWITAAGTASTGHWQALTFLNTEDWDSLNRKEEKWMCQSEDLRRDLQIFMDCWSLESYPTTGTFRTWSPWVGHKVQSATFLDIEAVEELSVEHQCDWLVWSPGPEPGCWKLLKIHFSVKQHQKENKYSKPGSKPDTSQLLCYYCFTVISESKSKIIPWFSLCRLCHPHNDWD